MRTLLSIASNNSSAFESFLFEWKLFSEMQSIKMQALYCRNVGLGYWRWIQDYKTVFINQKRNSGAKP
ncbi:MAG: hypothetical protein BWY82_00209 [Verrucomicrobia bacterium ADurb.Bin474]|nr:MAG: hypothetical protein BWY82_00209 [Verrucomicrobia bacterium ADurb.Bin474]